MSPEDFETKCPEGGCTDPCTAKLSCGLHKCRRQCHRMIDHSNTPCEERVEKTCEERQHKYSVPCHQRKQRCPECLKEEEAIRRRVKRDLDLEKKCLAREAQYLKELEEIQDEIAREKRLAQEEKDQKDRKDNLDKAQNELRTLRTAREQSEAIQKSEEKEKAAAAKTDQGRQPTMSGQDADGSESDDGTNPECAKNDWKHQKIKEHAKSQPLDMLMDMIGLEEVKQKFLEIKASVDTAVRQRISPRNERFSCVFLGNPGTGKTTVARIYARFLTDMGVIPGTTFEETTGAKLANIGVSGCQKMLEGLLNKGGGVVFIDEAYQLSSGNSSGGAAVLDFLLAEVENLRGKIVFVLAGYAKQMESFFAHNPGFPSRFPTEIKFEDYTDKELVKILAYNIEKRWAKTMKVEDGLSGLYCRIVARRIGRGRGKEGFGNARAIENVFQAICRRQAKRLKRARKAKKAADDMLLTKEDLIGPEPSNALLKSNAWKSLQKLIGLASVKSSLKALVDTLKTNYQRELNEDPIIEYSLNRVFLGNPGTGKTTIAKLYGQILVDLGMLSNGEVVVKNPADFVAAVIGGSQKQTKGILAATVGKVLVIDEAYGLYGGGTNEGSGFDDPYKTDVVDTIVAEVQSVPGDDRCVLLLGYKEQMESMFQNVNPGLSRRFPLASAFEFEDFTTVEMGKILQLKLNTQAYKVTDEGRRVALEMLDRVRNRPHFGNAGEIDILLNDAKARHQKRHSAGKTSEAGTLEAYDFDEDFDRSDRSETNISKLFEGTIGCEKLVATLRGYQEDAKHLKQLGMDPKANIPFTFLFRGPPGTGKTTTARKMGKIFYDAGFLSSTKLINCSASDLVGKYVGHTGPKVRKLLDQALGRVLLIDEAYRLAEGGFAKEALDELVDAVTKEKYHKKLIIILAGYEDDINRLLQVNPGLTSRFPETVDFHSLPADKCIELLTKKLQEKNKELEKLGTGMVELDCLETPAVGFYDELLSLFAKLSEQSGWASARDVETVSKNVFNASLSGIQRENGKSVITITSNAVRSELDKTLREREARGKQSASKQVLTLNSQPMASQDLTQTCAPASASKAADESSTKKGSADDADPSQPPPPPPQAADAKEISQTSPVTRDASVSDAVWEQLQKDAAAEVERERDYQEKLKLSQQLDEDIRNGMINEELEEERLKKELDEAKRQAVLQKLLKRRQEDEAKRKKIVQEILAEEERRKRAEEVQRKLREQGLCVAGFAWIQQAGGYRCAGGSHWVSDDQLGKM